MSLLRNIMMSTLRLWTPQVTSVRYRYHEDKVKKGPLVRRMGYEENIDFRGTLAHSDGSDPICQMRIYRPTNPWQERKALFGQNDYIDILGNENIHPTDISYNVPAWLRGIKGNEYQILLRKRKIWSKGIFPIARPTKWKHINQRIKFLYKYLNRKTKTGYSVQ